jgi:hypothetical protein
MDSVLEFIVYVAGKFATLYKRVKRFIMNTLFSRRTRTPLRPSNPPVLRRSTSPPRKKFQILNQNTQTPPLRFTKVRNTTKFTNMTETRPQKCPRCLTSSGLKPGNITKAEGQWCCKTCDYKW